MRGKYLQSSVTTGRLTLPVVGIITTTCWLVCFLLISDFPERMSTYSLLETLQIASPSLWVDRIISFLLYTVVGYFLISMNNSFGIIRVRASVQTSVYWLLVASCPVIHQLDGGGVTSIFLFLSIYFLFGSYQSLKPAVSLLHAFLFLGTGSLVFPKITLFAPLLWLGAHNFKALTLRSFMASLIGWCVPYWFLFSYCYFYDRMETFYQPFIELGTFHPFGIDHFRPYEIATIGYCLLLFIASSIHIFAYGFQDKLRTRTYLYFLILLNFCIFLFILLQPVYSTELLSLLLISVSFLIGHMVALTKSKTANILFIGSVIGLMALFGFNLWMLL